MFENQRKNYFFFRQNQNYQPLKKKFQIFSRFFVFSRLLVKKVRGQIILLVVGNCTLQTNIYIERLQFIRRFVRAAYFKVVSTTKLASVFVSFFFHPGKLVFLQKHTFYVCNFCGKYHGTFFSSIFQVNFHAFPDNFAPADLQYTVYPIVLSSRLRHYYCTNNHQF